MLDKFYSELIAADRAKNTVKNVTMLLGKTQSFLGKPLEEATWEDLLAYIEQLHDDDYSESSIQLIKAKIRQFYAYCYEETDDTKYLKLIKKLKGVIPKKVIRPQDLLTPAEVKRLINVATMEQDRAIVSILYESGMRAGEFMALTIGMVQMDEAKQEVTFNIPDTEGCKTGARTVVCLEIYGYVQDWLKCHPNPEPDENFIQIKAFAIADRLSKLFERAGIKKPCNPHNFRHSTITHAVMLGMQESAIKLRFWGNLNTNQLSTYISLSEQMQADAYKKAKGMGSEEVKVINPLASRCVKCGKLIQKGNMCEQCEGIEKVSIENLQLKQNLKLVMEVLGIDPAKSNAKEELEDARKRIDKTLWIQEPQK